ncbi:MAG: amidohydrolase [Nitriliruptorales bacterium]|nr:amidohydrolase [Nitriliruptorales bacterium]
MDLRPPYPGYLDRLTKSLTHALPDNGPPPSHFAGVPERLGQAISAAVERRAQDIVTLSHDIHAKPELVYAEHESVRRLASLLADHGHDAEIGVFGIDTALRATARGTAGSDRPRVAILAEYDALPGIGHACGHNVIAAAAAGAFMALADVIRDLDGSVVLYGCPAEEGGGGKELMARAGAFDDVDAAVMLHPAGFEVSEHPWIGVRTIDVVYQGLTAHASMFPFLGRNALDAVVTAYNGISQLRQHILPSDRIHGIITDGGQKPNIVPGRAAASFFLRSVEPETLRELCDRARTIFEAAAHATGTKLEIEWDPVPVYLPVRNNSPLANRYAQHLVGRGRQVLPPGVIPDHLTASTDLGNVSVRIPAIHPTLKIAPADASIHTAEFAAHAISAEADRGCVDGAIGLALTAADFLTDAALRQATRDAFEDGGGALDVDALLA